MQSRDGLVKMGQSRWQGFLVLRHKDRPPCQPSVPLISWCEIPARVTHSSGVDLEVPRGSLLRLRYSCL